MFVSLTFRFVVFLYLYSTGRSLEIWPKKKETLACIASVLWAGAGVQVGMVADTQVL